ncbi:Hcp family type VI secretion system effector [Geobacter anodireducens]
MAMPAHMTLTGEKQGKIDGSCELQGRENTIQLYEMKHDIHMPRNPHDGLPTGKRVHGPLSIVKMFDKSSPKLYQALCTGEHMKNVQIKWYRINKQGLEEHYFTTTLEDAIVVEMKPYMPMTLLPDNEPTAIWKRWHSPTRRSSGPGSPTVSRPRIPGACPSSYFLMVCPPRRRGGCIIR